MSNAGKKGKFNVIDLVVILVVVLAVGFVAVKLLHIGEDKTPLQKVQITYFEEECPDFVPQYTHIGDPLFDGTENQYLGVVTEVYVDEAQTYHYNEYTKETSAGPKDNYCSVYITGEVDGTMTANGAVVGSTIYAPGHTMILHAGTSKYYLVVYDVKPVE